MSYKKVGGLHFVRLGRFGFSFFISSKRQRTPLRTRTTPSPATPSPLARCRLPREVTHMPMNHAELVNSYEYARGFDAGRAGATRITLGESNYGATRSAIVAVEFTSLSQLKDEIRSRRDRRHGDNPGMAYLWTCELIHIHHNDYNSVALLKCATHWDI